MLEKVGSIYLLVALDKLCNSLNVALLHFLDVVLLVEHILLRFLDVYVIQVLLHFVVGDWLSAQHFLEIIDGDIVVLFLFYPSILLMLSRQSHLRRHNSCRVCTLWGLLGVHLTHVGQNLNPNDQARGKVSFRAFNQYYCTLTVLCAYCCDFRD